MSQMIEANLWSAARANGRMMSANSQGPDEAGREELREQVIELRAQGLSIR